MNNIEKFHTGSRFFFSQSVPRCWSCAIPCRSAGEPIVLAASLDLCRTFLGFPATNPLLKQRRLSNTPPVTRGVLQFLRQERGSVLKSLKSDKKQKVDDTKGLRKHKESSEMVLAIKTGGGYPVPPA